jgi:hypothetical protein
MLQVAGYWWRVLRIGCRRVGELAGIGHPSRWPYSIAVAAASIYAAYYFNHDANDAVGGVMAFVYGLAGICLVLLPLIAAQFVLVPPDIAAKGEAETRRLQAIVSAPRPKVGRVRIMIDEQAEAIEAMYHGEAVADGMAERFFLAGKRCLEDTLHPEWARDFSIQCRPPQIEMSQDMSAYVFRLANWLRKCTGQITEEAVLTYDAMKAGGN